jgi:hypothetical protein
MNQHDTDMLQIALGSSEHFNEDAPTPANPDPFRDSQLLDSLLDDSPNNSSSDVTNWHSSPDRAVVEFYICHPGSKLPQSCIEGETILSKVFRNIRDVVFNNEFYISALKEEHKEIANLYPFWQLIQASLSYELTIIGIGYVKDGASDPLQSYHTMDFPMTPKSILEAPRPAHNQDYTTFPPKVELAVYLDFAVHNPNQPRTHNMEPNSKMADMPPITITPKPGSILVEATSAQSHESELSGPIMHKTLMAPPLPRLPTGIKSERPDDDEITILSSTMESESERPNEKERQSQKAERENALLHS